jgi:hypothetical protein
MSLHFLTVLHYKKKFRKIYCRLRLSENWVMIRILGSKRDEVRGKWRKLHNEELNDLYCLPNIFSGDKIQKNEFGGACSAYWKRRSLYRVLVWKSEGKRPFEGTRLRWEDNIKMDLQELGFGGTDWMELVQDSDK